MNKQLRVHQQNFKDASYQNSNYSLVYDNPDKNVRADINKSIKTQNHKITYQNLKIKKTKLKSKLKSN